MEKRILVAFLLSFIVLMVWTKINPPPKDAPLSQQVTENKELEVNSVAQTEPAVSNNQVPVVQELTFSEDIVELENDKIKVEFSNVGGAIKKVIIKKFNDSLPLTKIFSISSLSQAQFLIKNTTNDSVTYEYRDGDETIVKEYRLADNEYLIKANVQKEKMSSLDIRAYSIDSSQMDEDILKSAKKSLFEYSIGLINKVIRKNQAVAFNEKENKKISGEVSWVGYRSQYYCLVVKPQFKSDQYSLTVENSQKLDININPVSSSESIYSADIYIGPQNLHTLAAYNKGFENIMVFSNWGILDFFAKMIYFFLHFLHGILKSWGFAILLLGLALYGITYPLTVKSMTSMRKMQVLQPKMKNLQAKHKNDHQKLNKEMMELYKEHKVNPLGGCLPMLLQMPIFYGLYQVLWRSESLKGASFLWIKDLSEPDRLAALPFTIPFIGNELNILPILMAVIMFFQQKFTSRNMVISDENQMTQQKMMQILMPIMMGFIFYHFASGLCLYFTVFYLLSTLTQWKMSKVNAVSNE